MGGGFGKYGDDKRKAQIQKNWLRGEAAPGNCARSARTSLSAHIQLYRWRCAHGKGIAYLGFDRIACRLR